jgi:predicted MFS family arabinose efflux permease
MNSADTLTILAVPPLSLAILATSTLRGVAVGTISLLLVGAMVGLGVVRQLHSESPPPRPFGFRMRRGWLVPLSIALFYMVHWGVLSAYLPSRADRAGADIGPFFICDGVAVLISRPLIGWLTNRVGSHWLVLIGLALTVAGVVVAVLPPTTPSILVVGLFTGFGGASAITPLQVDLSHRSDDTDRGSAFALLSAAMSGGLLLGSAGLSPIVGIWGFEGAALVAIGGLCLPAIVMFREPNAWVPRPTR